MTKTDAFSGVVQCARVESWIPQNGDGAGLRDGRKGLEMDGQLTKKLIVEFIGTFALLFMGIGAIALTGGTDIVAIALAHGLAIGLLIMAAGHISGGFFNPAVTLGMVAARRMDVPTAGLYIVAQLLGALAGTLAIFMTFPNEMRDTVRDGVPAVGAGFSSGNALVAEIVTTFFLVFVIFGVAVDQRSAKGINGLVIGLTISIGILATGAVSGAALNPARWFGPAVAGGHWDDFWIWIVGPIVGGILGALVYHDVLMTGEGLEPDENSASARPPR
ncbi:MAG: aquaporin [Chloroflexota bacterium]|nr:aquaporin [Chloroflexota bacterium]